MSSQDEKKSIVIDRESIETFLARGGKVTHCKAHKAKGFLSSQMKTKSGNGQKNSKERSIRAETKMELFISSSAVAS